MPGWGIQDSQIVLARVPDGTGPGQEQQTLNIIPVQPRTNTCLTRFIAPHWSASPVSNFVINSGSGEALGTLSPKNDGAPVSGAQPQSTWRRLLRTILLAGITAVTAPCLLPGAAAHAQNPNAPGEPPKTSRF